MVKTGMQEQGNRENEITGIDTKERGKKRTIR